MPKRVTISHPFGFDITPPRTGFEAGFLDNGEKSGNNGERCINLWKNFDEIFPNKGAIFVVCAPDVSEKIDSENRRVGVILLLIPVRVIVLYGVRKDSGIGFSGFRFSVEKAHTRRHPHTTQPRVPSDFAEIVRFADLVRKIL